MRVDLREVLSIAAAGATATAPAPPAAAGAVAADAQPFAAATHSVAAVRRHFQEVQEEETLPLVQEPCNVAEMQEDLRQVRPAAPVGATAIVAD